MSERKEKICKVICLGKSIDKRACSPAEKHSYRYLFVAFGRDSVYIPDSMANHMRKAFKGIGSSSVWKVVSCSVTNDYSLMSEEDIKRKDEFKYFFIDEDTLKINVLDRSEYDSIINL